MSKRDQRAAVAAAACAAYVDRTHRDLVPALVKAVDKLVSEAEMAGVETRAYAKALRLCGQFLELAHLDGADDLSFVTEVVVYAAQGLGFLAEAHPS